MKKASIHYRDIGDYLSREQKLKIISDCGTIANPVLTLQKLTPDTRGDWLNKCDDTFGTFIPLAAEVKFATDATSVFSAYSMGLVTNRDAWCYNCGKDTLATNVARSIRFYNEQVSAFVVEHRRKPDSKVMDFVEKDSTKFSWDRTQRGDIEKGRTYEFRAASIRTSLYRPFFKQWVYFDRSLNNCVYRLPRLFPTTKHGNRVICVSGVGVTKEFSALITDTLPDLELVGKNQCFPLYYYEKVEQEQVSLFDRTESEYIRRDGVTDFILEQARLLYGPKVKKEDIFYYVYGLLHSPDYRTRYSADLKKMLPRLQLVEEPKAFWAFSKAGRDLAQWHLDYETVEPWPVKETKTHDNYTVDQMRFAKNGKDEDKSTVIYNASITISGIPLEAYDYIVNGKSAIDWVMERYAVSVHKESGIRNDPNDWAKEQGDPRYILDLLKRVIRVSVETVRVVKSLPPLP